MSTSSVFSFCTSKPRASSGKLRRADEVNLSAAQSAANTQLSELQEELELLQLEVEMRREERVTAEEQVVNAQQQLTQMSGY